MNAFLALTPQTATPALLYELEALGLIIRLAPRRHEMPTAHGQAIGRPAYPATDVAHGGLLLLACAINQPALNDSDGIWCPRNFS